MLYVLAVIAAIVAAVVGWFVAAAVGAWVAGLFGMSDFEGGRGMFAAFVVGPVGGLTAMVVAPWLVFRFGAGRAALAPTLLRVGVVLAAIVMLVVAAILIRLATIDTYSDTLPPTLEFEIRIPVAMQPTNSALPRVELHTDKNVGEGPLAGGWVSDGGHAVIAGSVPLAFKTRSRLLVVSLPEQPTRLFRLSLSRDPASTPTLSEWRHADHLDRAGEAQPLPAPPGDPVEMRCRVQRAETVEPVASVHHRGTACRAPSAGPTFVSRGTANRTVHLLVIDTVQAGQHPCVVICRTVAIALPIARASRAFASGNTASTTGRS